MEGEWLVASSAKGSRKGGKSRKGGCLKEKRDFFFAWYPFCFLWWAFGWLWRLDTSCFVLVVPNRLCVTKEGLESAETALSRLTLQVKMGESVRDLPVDPLVQVGGADIIGKWYFQASQAPVVVCEELRQKPNLEGGKTTKHLEFDIKQLPGVSWRTADNLEVLPQNPSDVVEWFAERLKVHDHLEHYMTFTRTNTTKPVKTHSFRML